MGDEGRLYTHREWRELVEGMCEQFGYRVVKDGVPCLSTGGLSDLEAAFQMLGWDDPMPWPEGKCYVEGCPEWASSGIPGPACYMWLCSNHAMALHQEERQTPVSTEPRRFYAENRVICPSKG